jgi:hypothetical protein
MMLVALAYATRYRWRVFPIGRDCRTPLCAHGCHDASAERFEIDRLFMGRSDANVALACGPASGVFALDVDVKGADGRGTLAELEDAHGWLPETWTSRTPSGGQHLLFAYPGGRALRNRVGFRPGLDCRAEGGSIALPPSRRADGCYRWTTPPGACPLAVAPAWLLDLIDPPEPPRTPAPPIDFRSLDTAARYVRAAVDAECRALATMAPNSGRNAQLFRSACSLGELIAGDVLPERVAVEALEAAAVECGLVREDGWPSVRATIRSGFSRGAASPREIDL